jgi:methionine-rich copper-binding protein CopC
MVLGYFNEDGGSNYALERIQFSDGTVWDVETVKSMALQPTTSANINSYPTGSVTINGQAMQGKILTAGNKLADEDGLGTISYQWQAAGLDINGAVDSSYMLTQDEIGKSITVTARYMDQQGIAESLTSKATAVVVVADISTPLIIAFSPTDATTNAAVNSDITITFNEPIQKGTGTIAIHNGSATGTVVESYDAATSANLTISGATLTINPTSDLTNGKHYFITLYAGSVKDIAGNSYAGTDTYDFTTATAASLHDLNGAATFWKTGLPITAVTSSLASASAVAGTQPIEFRNLQTATDGTRTIEIWETSPTADINSVQLDLALPTGSIATWQDATGLPAGWNSSANTDKPGQFILGGIGTTALSAGSVKIGTLTLTAPANPQHFELSLTAGQLGNDTIPAFALSSDSMTTGTDGLYQHLAMNDGAYTLTSAKVSGTAESNAVKANDALAALKIAVGMNPNADGSVVSPYQYLAADVNHDGQVKAADALNILKMAVKLGTAPEMEWLFVPESVGSESMSRTHVVWPDNPMPVTLDMDQELQLIGIVKGDVNGSWSAVG